MKHFLLGIAKPIFTIIEIKNLIENVSKLPQKNAQEQNITLKINIQNNFYLKKLMSKCFFGDYVFKALKFFIYF